MTVSSRAAAEKHGIKVPTKRTLSIYGLSESEWVKLIADQGWKCAICHKSSATWNTDHEHVFGWRKMPAKTRKIYVRGILCWLCNKNIVPSNFSAERATRMAKYLRDYEERRDGKIQG